MASKVRHRRNRGVFLQHRAKPWGKHCHGPAIQNGDSATVKPSNCGPSWVVSAKLIINPRRTPVARRSHLAYRLASERPSSSLNSGTSQRSVAHSRCRYWICSGISGGTRFRDAGDMADSDDERVAEAAASERAEDAPGGVCVTRPADAPCWLSRQARSLARRSSCQRALR